MYHRAIFADSVCCWNWKHLPLFINYQQGGLFEDSSIDVSPFSTLKLQFREVCVQMWHGARSHSCAPPAPHPPKQVDTAWNKKRPFCDGLNPSLLRLPWSSPSSFSPQSWCHWLQKGTSVPPLSLRRRQFSLEITLEQLLGVLILYYYRVPCLPTTDWSYFRYPVKLGDCSKSRGTRWHAAIVLLAWITCFFRSWKLSC